MQGNIRPLFVCELFQWNLAISFYWSEWYCSIDKASNLCSVRLDENGNNEGITVKNQSVGALR